MTGFTEGGLGFCDAGGGAGGETAVDGLDLENVLASGPLDLSEAANGLNVSAVPALVTDAVEVVIEAGAAVDGLCIALTTLPTVLWPEFVTFGLK